MWRCGSRALPPRSLATARQLPGWTAAEAEGRVFPTALAAVRAYVGDAPTRKDRPRWQLSEALLASWNDTPTRQAIVDFVDTVTDEGGDWFRRP